MPNFFMSFVWYSQWPLDIFGMQICHVKPSFALLLTTVYPRHLMEDIRDLSFLMQCDVLTHNVSVRPMCMEPWVHCVGVRGRCVELSGRWFVWFQVSSHIIGPTHTLSMPIDHPFLGYGYSKIANPRSRVRSKLKVTQLAQHPFNAHPFLYSCQSAQWFLRYDQYDVWPKKETKQNETEPIF